MRIVALILAAAVAFPALAANSNANQQVGADKDKLVCKRETPIGSLIATRKVCLTRAQWVERQTRGNEEARRQADDNAARNPTPSN